MPEILSGRTFGIPNVVLIGAAALGVWFLFLRGRATGPTSKAGTSPSGQATTDYSLGYAQGQQAATANQQASSSAQASSSSQSQCPPDTPVNLADWRRSSAGFAITWEYAPSGSYGTFIRNCVAYSHIESGAAVQQILSQGGKVYFFPTPGNPIPGNLGSVWQATPLTGQGAGVTPGVGGPSRHRAAGSRSHFEWHDAHPMVGGRVPYPHYVAAVGGPANHVREVHRVARQAGVHPARVLMLNPEHTGRIRVA